MAYVVKQCKACKKVAPHTLNRKANGVAYPTSCCNPCRNIRRREWRIENPEAVHHENILRYGSNRMLYAAMLKKQKNVCAICKGPQRPAGRRLAVDHRKGTKYVRGLLCSPCNLAIGLMRHSPAILKRATMYLKKHGET